MARGWELGVDLENTSIQRSMRRSKLKVVRLLQVGDYVCQPDNVVGEVVSIGEARQCGGTRLIASRRLAHLKQGAIQPAKETRRDGRLFEYHSEERECVTILLEKQLRLISLGTLASLPGNVFAVIMGFLPSKITTPTAVSNFLNHKQQPCPSILRLAFAKCFGMMLRCSKPHNTVASVPELLQGERCASFLSELQGNWKDISASCTVKETFSIVSNKTDVMTAEGSNCILFTTLPCGMIQKNLNEKTSLLLTVNYNTVVWSDGSVWIRLKKCKTPTDVPITSEIFVVQKSNSFGVRVGPIGVLQVTDNMLTLPAIEVIPKIKSLLNISKPGILQASSLKNKTLLQVLQQGYDAPKCQNHFVSSHTGKHSVFSITLQDKTGLWNDIVEIIESVEGNNDEILSKINQLKDQFGSSLFQKIDPLGRTLLDIACCMRNPSTVLIKKLCTETLIATASGTRQLPIHLVCGHVKNSDTAWDCVDTIINHWPPMKNDPLIALCEDSSGNTFIDVAIQWHSGSKFFMGKLLSWYTTTVQFDAFRKVYKPSQFQRIIQLAGQDIDSLIMAGGAIEGGVENKQIMVVDHLTLTFMHKAILVGNYTAAVPLSLIDGMISKCDWRGWLAFHYIAKTSPTDSNSKDYEKLFKSSLQHVDYRDTTGRTPVLVAAMNHNSAFINYFITSDVSDNLKAQVLLTPDHVGNNCVQYLLQMRNPDIITSVLKLISKACQDDYVMVPNTEDEFPKTVSLVSTMTGYSQEELPLPDALQLLLSSVTLNWVEGLNILLSSYVIEQQLPNNNKTIKSKILQHAINLNRTEIETHLKNLTWEVIPVPEVQIISRKRPLFETSHSTYKWVTNVGPEEDILHKVLGVLLGEEVVNFDIALQLSRHMLISAIEHSTRNTYSSIVARLCISVLQYGTWTHGTAEYLLSIAAQSGEMQTIGSKQYSIKATSSLSKLMEVGSAVGISGMIALIPSFSEFTSEQWMKLDSFCWMTSIRPYKAIQEILPRVIPEKVGFKLLQRSILSGSSDCVGDLIKFNSYKGDGDNIKLNFEGHAFSSSSETTLLDAAAVRGNDVILQQIIDLDLSVSIRTIKYSIHRNSIKADNNKSLSILVDVAIKMFSDVKELFKAIVESPLGESLKEDLLYQIISSEDYKNRHCLSELVIKCCSRNQNKFSIKMMLSAIGSDDVCLKEKIISRYLRSQDCCSDVFDHIDQLFKTESSNELIPVIIRDYNTTDNSVYKLLKHAHDNDRFSIEMAVALATRSSSESFSMLIEFDTRGLRHNVNESTFDDSVLKAALQRGQKDFVLLLIDDLFDNAQPAFEKVIKLLLKTSTSEALELLMQKTNYSYVDILSDNVSEYSCMGEYCLANGYLTMLMPMAKCKVFKPPYSNDTHPTNITPPSAHVTSMVLHGHYDVVSEIASLKSPLVGNWDFTKGYLSSLREECISYLCSVTKCLRSHFEYSKPDNLLSCAEMHQVCDPETILDSYMSAAKIGNESQCLSLQTLSAEGKFYNSNEVCRRVIDFHIRNNSTEALKAYLLNDQLPHTIFESGWFDFVCNGTFNNEKLSLLSYAILIASPECVGVVKSVCSEVMLFEYCASPYKLLRLSQLMVLQNSIVGSWCQFPSKSNTHKVFPGENPTSRFLYDYSKLDIDKSSRCHIQWKSNTSEASPVTTISRDDQRSYEMLISIGSNGTSVLKYLSDKARRSLSGPAPLTSMTDVVKYHSNYEYLYEGKLCHKSLILELDIVEDVGMLFPVDPKQLESFYELLVFCPNRSSKTEMITDSESPILTPLGYLSDTKCSEPDRDLDLCWWDKDSPVFKPHPFRHRKETRSRRARLKEIECFKLWSVCIHTSGLAFGDLLKQ